MVTEVDLFSRSECVREGATLRETGDGRCSSSEESITSRRFLGSGRTGIAGWEGRDEGLIYNGPQEDAKRRHWVRGAWRPEGKN